MQELRTTLDEATSILNELLLFDKMDSGDLTVDPVPISAFEFVTEIFELFTVMVCIYPHLISFFRLSNLCISS